MTDYIYEIEGRRICEYVDDGISRTVVVTRKASVLHRPYREPSEYRKLMRTIMRIMPRPEERR